MKARPPAPVEERTARLTILIDPRKKAVFERLCAAEDLTPSQVVRQLIRDYIERSTGQPWNAHAEAPAVEGSAAAHGPSRKASPSIPATRQRRPR